jgi:hypothetical protein
MCRNIKVLRNPTNQTADTEIRQAALQFVRKISGYRSPSKANSGAFEAAVDEIAAASRNLLNSLKLRV